MSIKGIYEAILGELPDSLKPVFLFGARHLADNAGSVRIVMYPTTDSYGARGRQGQVSTPEELYSYEGEVTFDIIVPTHDDFDKKHGLRDLLISLCHKKTVGSFTPVQGSWDLENGSAKAVRGEHYVLTVRFGQPVIKTTKEQTAPLALATPDEAPITGTISDE